MSLAEKFHGIRVFKGPDKVRPIQTEDYSVIGVVVTAPAADPAKYPPNEPVTIFSNDTAMRTALGATGTGADVLDAIDDQGIVGEVQVVVVPEGTSTVPQTKLEQTIANIVGNSATLTGVHAFKRASKRAKLLGAPGFTSQRLGNAKNPVMAEFEGVANRLKSIIVGDCPGTSKEIAVTYRVDFPDQKRVYIIDPGVLVSVGGVPVAQPASGRALGLFVKRDQEEGGPHVSPSNQAIGGIVGVSRTIPYYDGEPDSEANFLNQNNITTIIDNGRLWGNETLALDPLDRFVNVVRTIDAIDGAVVRSFRWAMDKNLNVPLAVAIIQSLDQFLTEAALRGWIISGRPSFEQAVNTNASMVSGVLVIDYDHEPYAPLQDLQFRASRNPGYYELVTDGISRAVEQITSTRRRLIYGINADLG